MTQDNPFHDEESLVKMQKAFLTINPNTSIMEMNNYFTHAEKENQQYGDEIYKETQDNILNMYNEFCDYFSYCKQNVSNFEEAVKHNIIWAEMLKKYPTQEESFDKYQEIMNDIQNEIWELIEELDVRLNKIAQQIDVAIKICVHDEKVTKQTYETIKNDDSMAKAYIEGMKIMLGKVDFSTIEEARDDARQFYLKQKQTRLIYENIKVNLPKTGKLKSTFNSAKTEYKNFLLHYTSTLEK